MKKIYYIFSSILIAFAFFGFGFIEKADAAIAFRASSTATASNATSISIAMPTGTVQGDVMVASIFGNANQAAILGITPPSGWTQVQKVDNQTGQYYPAVTLFIKPAGASEAGPYVFTFSNYSGGAYGGGWIATYTGVNTTAPVDISGSQNVGNSGATTTTYSTPNITTTGANEMLVFAYAGNCATNGFGTPSSPAGVSVIASNIVGGCTRGSGYYVTQATAGSSGSITSTAATASYGGAAILALKPLGADVTTTGNSGYSYNYFYSAGTVNNQTGNTVWYGTAWGAGSGYSGTACSALPNKTNYSTVSTGYNGSVSAYVSASASTLYYFCVYAYDSTSGLYYYSPTTYSLTTSAPQVPTMERVTKGEITTTTANITGNVAAENGASITAKGICYSSTNATPALSQGGTTCTSNGTGTGQFTANITTGLTANTLYYFRAYATNSAGSGYSAVDTFTTETTPPVGFPQIISTVGFYDRNNNTIHNVPMPATVNSGDLLLALISNDGNATVTVPSGWTQLFTTANSTSTRLGAYYKFAAGTEGGTTVNFATSASESMTAQVYRITDALAVEAGTATTGTSSTPDSPSLTPTWGATDSLWIPFAGQDYSSASVNSYPSNYTNGRRDADTYQVSQNQGALMSARRYLNATTEDPGIFTTNVSGPAWVANTIAIRPEPTTPTVTTNAVDPYGQTTATIKGTANPNGFATTGWFRYYTTDPVTCADSGGTRVPSASGTDLGSGSTGVDYSRNLTGLTPGTSYWVCAIASNSNGTGVGSPVRFDTAVGTPTSVTTSTGESGLGSYYATLNGSANPNNFASYGFFELYNTNPGSCLVSDLQNPPSNFVARYPSVNQVDDVSLGSGSTGQTFAHTISSGLTPNTAYWYCAFARNTYGTVGSSSPDTFSTPDGPINACDPPSGGNHTILTSCPFSGSIGGVDGGTGTNNTAVLTIGSARALTLNPAQQVAWGSISMQSGASINLGSGSSLRRSPLWVIDADGDGRIGSTQQYIGAQPAGGVRRNTVNTTYPYFSKILSATTDPDPSTNVVLDCNDSSTHAYRNITSLVTDADNDGYKTSAAAGSQCVGDSSTINGKTYYKDSSGNFTWLPDAQKLSATTDCYDNSAAPCPPSTPSLSNPSYSQVNVSWSATTGPAATGYDIQWCQGSTGCTPSTSISNVTSTYAHTGRSGSTIYKYHVIAKNAAGNSTPSTTQYITTSAACTNGYQDNDGDGVGQATYGCYTGNVVQVPAPALKMAPTTVVNDNSIGTVAWSGTVANLAAAGDSSVANLTGGGGGAISNYLKITNWGFSIPSGASIVGVIADVRAYHSTCCGYQSSLYSVKLVKGGTVTGSEGKSTSTLPASPAYTAHGAVNSLWGTSLTPADVNSTGFGIAIAFQASQQFNPGYGSLDHIRLKVFYTGGSPAPSGDYNDANSSCYVNLGTMYPDNDGDGYTVGSVSNVCIGGAATTGNVGMLSAPSGTADCYDGNANAKPGQTSYFDQPRGDGHPTLSYDYNCNNNVEIEQASYACCTENSGWITNGVYSGGDCAGTWSIPGACWAADVISEFSCNSNPSYCGKRRVWSGAVYGHPSYTCTSSSGSCSFSGCATDPIYIRNENPYYVNCK